MKIVCIQRTEIQNQTYFINIIKIELYSEFEYKKKYENCKKTIEKTQFLYNFCIYKPFKGCYF